LRKAAKAAEDAKKANKQDPKAQFKQSVIGAEGTGQNPQSSALGFGQFIRTTWINYFDRLFPDKATLTDDAKLAFRNVRTVAEAVIDRATEDYSKVLKSAGQQITAAGLYTVHVLGPTGAAKFLRAPATASTASVVGSDVVAKNRSLLGGTVAQAKAEIARRIGDSSGAVSSGAAAIEHALTQGLEDERKLRQRFFDEEQQTFAQVIDARKAQGLSAAEIAAVEHDAVEQSRQKLEGDILAKQAAGEYTDAEAQLRLQLNGQLAKLRDQTVERVKAQAEYAERERQIENTSRVASGMVAAQSELLKAREGLVTTAKGRRAIEERLLELQFRRGEASTRSADRGSGKASRTRRSHQGDTGYRCGRTGRS
jgi:DNA-binding transcriptional MerR regulator